MTVTGDLEMQAKPWLPDFPSFQLFSGSSGRREDWPPVQAHFPEPRLPSPPQGPSVEITDIWEVLFFFLRLAWMFREVYVKYNEEGRNGRTLREKRM